MCVYYLRMCVFICFICLFCLYVCIYIYLCIMYQFVHLDNLKRCEEKQQKLKLKYEALSQVESDVQQAHEILQTAQEQIKEIKACKGCVFLLLLCVCVCVFGSLVVSVCLIVKKV